MKKFVLFGLFCFLIIDSFSQTEYPIPEFDDKPMYYNSDSNKLETLERQTAKVVVKNKYFVIDRFFYFNNQSSSFRIKKGQPIQFIFKAAEPTKELELQIMLYKYTVNEKKNQREMQLSSSGAAGSKTMNTSIPFDYKKLDTGVYLISVDDLEAGEYGLATANTTYLFGVDN